MRNNFQVLGDRPKIKIQLTRDSVCAGDDYEAPHEKNIEVHSFQDPVALATEVTSGYLPSIAGVGHSWICILNDIRFASISAKGIRPLVRKIEFAEENQIHLEYHSASY